MTGKIGIILLSIIVLVSGIPAIVQCQIHNDITNTNIIYLNGDWIVNDAQIRENMTLVLKGNLTIQSGGNLTLRNVTLQMNSTASFEYRIDVQSGGALIAMDNDNSNVTESDATRFMRYNPTYTFFFSARPGSILIIRNSIIQLCGRTSAIIDREGLYIGTDNAWIDHCRINNTAKGVYLYNSDAMVSNNTIEWCDMGIMATAWSNGTIENNVIQWSNTFGIWVDGVNNVAPKGSNPLIINNRIYKTGRDVLNTGVAIEVLYSCNPIILNNAIDDWGEDAMFVLFSSCPVIKNTTFIPNGGNFGLVGGGGSWNWFDITNSSIQNTVNTDVFFTGSGGFFTNTTFNASSVNLDPSSNLTRRWFLNSLVNDTNGKLISDATIRIRDNSNGTYDKNFTTGANGRVEWTVLREYYQTQSTLINYGPYNLTVSKPGYQTTYAEVEMNESKTVVITIIDIRPPEIYHVPTPFTELGQTVNITANVTDNATVNSVCLNYTGTDSINHNVIMKYWDGNWSYEIPGQSDLGNIDYFIWANDTSGNANMTGIYQIQVVDVMPPEINHVAVVSASVFEAINITVNITDDIAVDEVFLNYTDVSGTNHNITMNQWSSNYSFDIPGQTDSGFIEYFIWANDSSGNDNLTIAYQIQILDVTSPEMIHVPIDSANVSETINITANVTDDVGVNCVYLNYTGVNETNYNVSMQKWNGNYSYEIPGQDMIGTVQYFIWANDSDGNENRTIEYLIQINDVIKPEINHVPVISANTGETINITANVTDDVSVNSVYLNYTGVNGTNYNVSMIKLNENYSYEIPRQNTIGIVQYFIWANDSDGNDNRTIEYSIQINDVVKPEINHVPVVSVNAGETINITANVTDDVAVHTVRLAYVYDPLDFTGMPALEDMIRYGDTWCTEITTFLPGTVTYDIWANDTSGNFNRTLDYQIQILDVVKPKIVHMPITSVNISVAINITATITDDIEVDSVYLNYTGINGINHNVSMNQWGGNWSYDIPGQASAGMIEYFIWCNDTTGNSNQTGIYQIQLNETIIPDTTPPTIISKSPTGVNISIATTITITFDEPMNITSFQDSITILPAITILSYSWTADNTTLTIIPSGNLSYNTTFNITIGIGAKDFAGNGLENPYSWEFTTELEEITPNGHDDNWLSEYWWIILIIVIVVIIVLYLYWRTQKEEEPEAETEEIENPE